jgi:transcriptional regulator with XRE-family HTH domain
MEDSEFQLVIDAIRKRLSEQLRDRSMTQEELVEKSGVTKGYLSQLLRGEAPNPGLRYVWKLARALDISLAELLGEGTDPDAETASPDPRYPRALKEYARDHKKRTGKNIPDSVMDKMYKTPGRGLGDRESLTREQWKTIHELVVMFNTGELEKLGAIVDFARKLES